jgi:hypothetical protein
MIKALSYAHTYVHTINPDQDMITETSMNINDRCRGGKRLSLRTAKTFRADHRLCDILTFATTFAKFPPATARQFQQGWKVANEHGK